MTLLRDLSRSETAARAAPVRGIASGTVVATLAGYLPVDFLEPGERVVTRAGMRVLRAVRVHRYSGPSVTIRASALGHDRPEHDLTLPASIPILIRDWRAGAIFGQDQAMVPAERLVDGEYVTLGKVLGLRLYELMFDEAEVVYAEGVELCCGVVPARSVA
ncbi:MAG: Hint domain-containing protein [Proteobacteria bacterium]|nr:Hint domain-containing protein [Pseudomonadota bacterium]MBS0572289.1 Hint domain-containing protein [Pseudomonadota bacterium]